MESKLFKLDIKFSQIKFLKDPDTSSLILQLSFGNLSSSLKFQSSASMSLPNYSQDSVLEMRLEQGSAAIGAGTISLGNLCEKTLTGDFKKWVKLDTPDEDKKLKIKIEGSLRNPRRLSPSKQRPGYLSSSPQKNRSKCNYIRKLTQAEDREKEIQVVIQRVKARMEMNYGDLIESGIKTAVSPGRSPARSPLRKQRTLDRAGDDGYALEIPSRFELSLEQLSSNEPHLLRYSCIALSERIKVMRTQADEYESIFGVIASFQDPINDLKKSVDETKDQLQREDKKMDELVSKIQEERSLIKSETEEADQSTRSIEDEIEKIKNEIEMLRQENEALKVEETVEEINKDICGLHQELSKNEADREKILKETEDLVKQFANASQDNLQAKLLDEKFQLIAQLQSKNSIFDHLVIENLQLGGEISLLSAQLLAEEDAKARLSEIESHSENFSSASENLKEDLGKLSSQRDKIIEDGLRLTKKIEIDVKDMEKKCGDMKNDIENKENEIGKNLDIVQKLSKANEQTLEWIKKDEADFEEKHNKFLEKYEADKNAKDLLVKELGFFSDLTLMHVSSSITEQRIHKRLDEMLEEKDHQKYSLQRMITSGSKKASSPRKENISESSIIK